MASRATVIPELEKMTVEQLKAVKEQSDLEVNLLQDSLNNIRTATNRLDLASTALNDLSLRSQGKKMLVPLTASLYVPGTLDDAENVLVDVGTGYFIEKTMEEAKNYCERKINLLKSNYDQLLEVFVALPPNLKGSLTITDERAGKKYKVPVSEEGTVRATDLKKITTGNNDKCLKLYDPGYLNTAHVCSSICYIDGVEGILRYRGYPIKELGEGSSFLDVAYLLNKS